MIRVETGSRLHFGLFNPACVPGMRRFGGVGLMIEEPSLRLAVSPANAWTAVGPLADRALAFAQHFASTLPSSAPRVFRLSITQAPPEHAGFGTGTQLGLAVASACQRVAGLPPLDVQELCRRVGRGLRSGLGAHGYFQGGFLVDGGKFADDSLAPLVARAVFPPEWRLVIVLPEVDTRWHGVAELEAFEQLTREVQPALIERLCRLVLLGMLPALTEHDLAAFGEAIHEFNARVGEAFAAVQGGTYTTPRVASVVEFFRRQGVKGVGQSSWGPALFAVVEDQQRAEDLLEQLHKQSGLRWEQVWVTRGRNDAANLEVDRGSDALPTPPSEGNPI
jgi:beta-RFAP synthase